MSESLNIHKVLETGYFTTSRSKSTQPDDDPYRPITPPRSRYTPPYDDEPPRRTQMTKRPRTQRDWPPSPTVEDEVESLAREYGSTTTQASEETPSRGDLDQFPVILEVHEHNPERRFVIIEDADKERESGGDDQPDDHSRKEPSPPGGPYTDRKNREERPLRERRRSRQDLPPIDTNGWSDGKPGHHRTRSTATGIPSDYFAKRQTQAQEGDGLLSPVIIKHGATRRDTGYYTGKPPQTGSRSPGPRSTSTFTETKYDGKDRREASRDTHRRSGSTTESSRPKRRFSVGEKDDTRYRDSSYSAKPRDGDRDTRSSRNASRDDSRPRDDYVPTSRTSGRRRAKSIIVQDEPPRSEPELRAVPRSTTLPPDKVMDRGPSIATTIEDSRTRDRASTTALPYPEDVRVPTRANDRPSSTVPRVIPLVTPSVAHSNPSTSDPTMARPAPSAAPRATESGPPLSFDPSGAKLERPIGSVRRYSENKPTEQIRSIPDCPRTKPMAGMMDWLCLPRTDFNICPDCYGSIFAHSEYRTQFQPMLRPTDKPLACDFGSSPWYRIAWLLTIKNQSLDLRMFHLIANVSTATRNQSCPGARRATRQWLTVRDPSTRRPIRDFTVCQECAKTVEALLPNLTGIFVPLDTRSEPMRSVCALHFTPERKRFVMYFDALETTSDNALAAKEPPNMSYLALSLEKLSVSQCREDSPIPNGHWHNMQFLPDFTVCSQCFDEVVRPKLGAECLIARNFYTKTQRLSMATCQLYSPRMRKIFRTACAQNDSKYLAEKVRERLEIEADIHAKLMKLDRDGLDEAWTEGQVSKLIREWEKWE